MTDFEYRAKDKDITWDKCLFPWSELEEGHDFSVVLDYQFRKVPSFEAGYFQYVGRNADPHVSVIWFDQDPGSNYVRVNVTPVKPGVKPGDELTEEDLDALRGGAEVRDRDNDTWTKASNGYWYLNGNGSDADAGPEQVFEYSPIHLVSE